MHLSDCQACGGPCPVGRPCPHCGRAPARSSLRATLLGFALIGLTSCSSASSSPIGVLYGIAITPPCETDAGIVPSEDCRCDGDQVCSCNDAGVCSPIDPCLDHSIGEICTCAGAETCTCGDGGVCAPYAYLRDGG